MKELIAVFIGSGLGGIARFTLARWIGSFYTHHFPYATFIVNVLACLLLGVVIGLADHKQLLSSSARLFLAVGFCGGFSTFSAFSGEALTLLQQGQYISALLYILLSVGVCVVATFGGLLLARA